MGLSGSATRCWLDPAFDPQQAIRENALELARRQLLLATRQGSVVAGLLDTRDLVQELPGRVRSARRWPRLSAARRPVPETRMPSARRRCSASLDNAESIGPGSALARATARRGRSRGLNENYARELLELHTLGVDGGYTQEDVLELARALTGWSIGVAGTGGRATRPRPEALATGALGFAFRAAQHEPGVRTILGRRYAQEGEEQAAAVIRDLCAHPSAARFVATKLVRHFVADEPPAAAVAAVAAEFTRSGGDLGRVARAR